MGLGIVKGFLVPWKRCYNLIMKTGIVRAKVLLFLVELVTDFVEAAVGMRVLLKFLGASSQASFVRWVYETSAPLLAPFEGMFPTRGVGAGFTLEVSALFALVAYSVAGYLISQLVVFVGSVAGESRKEKE